MNSFIVLLDGAALALQLMAAWFGYKIYRFNRLSTGWIALIIAFLIQVVRRIFQVYYDYVGVNIDILFDRILMFFISLLLVIGLWSMLKNFENFDLVQNNVDLKINRRVKRK